MRNPFFRLWPGRAAPKASPTAPEAAAPPEKPAPRPRPAVRRSRGEPTVSLRAELARREADLERMTVDRDRLRTEAAETARWAEQSFAAFAERLAADVAACRTHLAATLPRETARELRAALADLPPDAPRALDLQAVVLAASGWLSAAAARDWLLDADAACPAPWFSRELYRQLAGPAAAPTHLDPLVHGLLALAQDGDTPLDRFAYAYGLWNRDLAPKNYALEMAVLSGLPQFDRDFYLSGLPEADRDRTDPVAHYVLSGWRDGRSPCPDFDGARYAAEHPLLFLRKENPFLHWLATRDLKRPLPVPAARPEPGETPVPSPRVSVIVPNYNHAPYLEQRLDSIYGQTFDDFEVILLDDASTDDSPAILARYAARYPERTRLVQNSVNSGGVFRQWRAGLALARGDLCWIAESDDWCEPNFLASLVPAFDDGAVMEAQARCQFVDADGEPSAFTLDHYLEPVGAQTWHRSFVRSGLAEVLGGLGVRNTLPNISGVVFRRPAGLALLDDPDWLSLRICGDWLFHLHLLAGGRVAYVAETTNFFRLSAGSAGAESYRTPAYYREHEAVARTVARLYPVDAALLGRHRELLRLFYAERFPDDALHLDTLYDPDVEHFLAGPRTRRVLISLFAFSLGGGEIAPLRLAVGLARAGWTVLVHDFGYTPPEPAIRGLLPPNLPVVTARTPEAFLDLLAAFRPDVVNSHHQAVQAMIRRVRDTHPEAFAGVVHVSSMHGMYEGLPAAELDAQLPGLCACADAWTYVADKNLDPFRARGLYDPARFHKLPNGMDPPPVRTSGPTRRRLGIPEQAFVLCLASRALPRKGWREAVLAVELARELCGADIHLLLLGEGELFDEFVCLPLPDHIHLTGLVPEASPYFALCDMGLLPSTFAGESMPLAVMEALLAGKPVLATAVGEVPDMLRHGDDLAGALLPLEGDGLSVPELARRVVDFATDPERLARAARTATACAGRFRLDAMVRRFGEILDLIPARTA